MGVVVFSTWILTSIFPATVTVTAKTAVHEVEGRAVPDASGPQGRQLAFRPWSVGNRVLLPALEPDQGLIVLALLAGSLGAFMHAAQSFAAFVGNRELKASWVWWYLLRPPIGSVLGLVLYFVARAGLLGGASDAVSPYGVVAIGGLGGWFSKQATNKLAEVFDTLFSTTRPPDQKDELSGSPDAPLISEVLPAPIEAPAEGAPSSPVTILGSRFLSSAEVRLDGETLPATWKSSSEIATAIPRASLSKPGASLRLVVVNPTPEPTMSEPFVVDVAGGTPPADSPRKV
jgi:hypothetical protein